MALRQSFSLVKKAYDKTGKSNVRLTQSNLVLLAPINAASNSYTFPVLETDRSNLILPEEIRLNINDEFTLTHLQYMLFGKLTAVVTNPSPPPAMIVNPAFPKAIVRGVWFTHVPYNLNFAFAAIEPAYEGNLKVEVNNITYIDNWHLKKHQVIPYGNWATIKASAIGSWIAANNFATEAKFPVEPHIVLSGAKKNVITITLPESIAPVTVTPAWADDLGNDVEIEISHLAVILDGFKAMNAAAFQK